MTQESRILFLHHRAAGPVDAMLAWASILFSREERAAYRRMANASALLRLSLNPAGQDDDGIVLPRNKTLVRALTVAGFAVLGIVTLIAWHQAVTNAPGGGAGNASTAVHSCPNRSF